MDFATPGGGEEEGEGGRGSQMPGDPNGVGGFEGICYLREFVLTHVILAPGARGRVVPSRG